MTRSIASFDAFDRQLSDAREDVARLLAAEPDDAAILSVHLQLEALHGWTRGGRCPTQDEKDQLNFGLIASRELDSFPIAPTLYALASYVMYWNCAPEQ